jgi:hypothetical protein
VGLLFAALQTGNAGKSEEKSVFVLLCRDDNKKTAAMAMGAAVGLAVGL